MFGLSIRPKSLTQTHNTSKVSPSGISRSTDVSRFHFDAAAATDGSVDPTAMFQSVSEWLCELGVYPVSCFVFLRIFVVDVLDLDVYRCDLHMAVSPPRSVDLPATLRGISAWLRSMGAFQVSHFDFTRWFDLCRLDLDASALLPGSNDPMQMF